MVENSPEKGRIMNSNVRPKSKDAQAPPTGMFPAINAPIAAKTRLYPSQRRQTGA
jgi:hypothetical protein